MAKIVFDGHIGKEPEMKAAGSNNILQFSVAETHAEKDANGNWKDRKECQTTWHTVGVWGARGENLYGLIHKGDKVLVMGVQKSRQYQDKEGSSRTAYSVTAGTVAIIPKPEKNSGAGGNFQNPPVQAQAQPTQPADGWGTPAPVQQAQPAQTAPVQQAAPAEWAAQPINTEEPPF